MTDAATIAKVLGGIRCRDGSACHCPVPSHGKGRGDKRARRFPSVMLMGCYAFAAMPDATRATTPQGRGAA